MKAIRVVASLMQVVVFTASLAAGETLDLAGPWRLRLDPDDQGQTANWPALPLATTDEITLPTTTDRAGFGLPLDASTMQYEVPCPATTRFPGVADPVRADEHGYLVRRHLYVGPAWYEREIDIPRGWENRPVTLRIERALWKTQLWLDGERIGECDSLLAEHRYPLGALASGRHRLTICVDN